MLRCLKDFSIIWASPEIFVTLNLPYERNLVLTNTPGLVQIIERSFRHRNKASEVSQGQPNINEESIRLSYKLADLDEDRISQTTQPALVTGYLEVDIG